MTALLIGGAFVLGCVITALVCAGNTTEVIVERIVEVPAPVKEAPVKKTYELTEEEVDEAVCEWLDNTHGINTEDALISYVKVTDGTNAIMCKVEIES